MNKKNLPLILAFGVPLLFIIMVAAFVAIPSSFIASEYDFVYVDLERFYEGRAFSVEDGKVTADVLPGDAASLIAEDDEKDPGDRADWRLRNRWEAISGATFYRYRSFNNSVEPITFKEAQELTLSDSSTSPDGYVVERGSEIDGVVPFFFYDSRRGSYVIKKGLASKRIPYTGDYYDLEFIGWVLNE